MAEIASFPLSMPRFVFFLLSPLLTITVLRSQMSGRQLLALKQNKTNRKIASSLPKCSKTQVIHLCWCTAGVSWFSSAPVHWIFIILSPATLQFYLLICSSLRHVDQNSLSKRRVHPKELCLYLMLSKKEKKEKTLCKWSSFILSLLFSPWLIPLQTKSDRKHDAALRKTFAVCMSSSWQGSVKRALWRKSRLTKHFVGLFFSSRYLSSSPRLTECVCCDQPRVARASANSNQQQRDGEKNRTSSGEKGFYFIIFLVVVGKKI